MRSASATRRPDAARCSGATDRSWDLGGLAGSTRTQALAINDRGQITGFGFDGFETRALLWQDGRVQDLNDLIDPLDALHSSLLVEDAFGINNDGWIRPAKRSSTA